MERRAQRKAAQKINMRKNISKALLLTGVLCLAGIGGVSAYLTDYDQASNQFTVGKVDISLEEKNWKPEDHTKLEPGEDIKKDPQIRNTGTNDAFVYLEVSVPMATVTAAGDDGFRQNEKLQELFSFQAKEDWTRLDARTSGNSQVYVYTYNKILKPDEITESLFDKVTFLNIIEGQLDGEALEIPVRAYAIQTTGTGGDNSNVLNQAKSAYEKYVNQNRDQEGKVTA